jgi:protein phosphatase
MKSSSGNEPMRILPGNAQHIGSRRQQQDSFGFSDLADESFRRHGGVLGVVADGMGGMAHGDAASREAVRAFLSAYQMKTEVESIPEALLRSLNSSNSAVFQMALSMDAAEEMGTTLAAVVVADEKMHWISVGDSAIFLVRDREFTLCNEFHVFAHELDEQAERGALSREVALAHPEREALTAFLGSERIRHIDRSLRPLPLRPGDLLLLASDGLFKALSPEEMAAEIREQPQATSEALVARVIAAERPHQDNVTVLAMCLLEEAPAAVASPHAAQPAARNQNLVYALVALAVLLIGASAMALWSLRKPSGARQPGVQKGAVAPVQRTAPAPLEAASPEAQPQSDSPQEAQSGNAGEPSSEADAAPVNKKRKRKKR